MPEDVFSTDRRKKLLFLDDRSHRLHGALEKFSREFKVTLVCTAQECLRLLAYQEWDIVSLDHDLNGSDFQSLSSPTSGMEIIRYLESTGWPPSKPKPRFRVHSSNELAANTMVCRLNSLGFFAEWEPFGWKQYQNGVVAGAFDVIHLGYIRLFEEAKEHCHILTVCMHDKPNQIFTLPTRSEILHSIRYVDCVKVYSSESELTKILQSGTYDVRFVGDDHQGISSRENLDIDTVYIDRSHGWSATKYKKTIFEFMKGS